MRNNISRSIILRSQILKNINYKILEEKAIDRALEITIIFLKNMPRDKGELHIHNTIAWLEIIKYNLSSIMRKK